ncbi:MAG TPA: hypothetical protein VN541_08060 [Tepidisphaeraceae bacterium]|nr:hypothetical protein [Tepidisphaeraceae bacterium]
MRLKPLQLFLMILLSACLGVQTSEPAERRPVPHSGEQSRALNAIRQQFKEEYGRRDPADQLRLSQEFRKQAQQVAGSDPVRQYVFLREARTLALGAGDFDAAFGAIDDMSRAFAIDAEELKVSAISEAMDRARIPQARLLNGYLKVTDDALWDGDVNLAWQASRMAYRVAGTMRDPEAKQRVKQIDLRVHEARRELTAVIEAANKLQRQPDDPAANLIVGRYLCFAQGRWNEGIPLLAKGSDKKLADLADADNADLVDTHAMFNLAERWWRLPDSPQIPARRSHQRAAYWFEKALPRLSEPWKSTAQQHIAQAKSESRRP